MKNWAFFISEDLFSIFEILAETSTVLARSSFSKFSCFYNFNRITAV